jgi:biotin synthase-related radical SAM superfamily protein
LTRYVLCFCFCPLAAQIRIQYVLKFLEKAGKIFGKDRVTSNWVLGQWESDECVLAGETRLSELGMIPILRPISPHPLRKGEVEVERSSAERLLMLARATRKVLEDHGLRTGFGRDHVLTMYRIRYHAPTRYLIC